MKKIIAVMAVLITLFSMGNVSASAAAKVAALMYHSVTTDSSRWNDYTISPEQLDADIQYFKSCGALGIWSFDGCAGIMDFPGLGGRKLCRER